MARSDQFASITELTRHEERVAAESLARASADVAELERQLSQLRAYHHEYQLGTGRGVGAALTAAQMKDARRFLQQLEQAVLAAEQQLAGRRQLLERARQQWLVQHRRVEALAAITERERRSEAHQLELVEQFETDDLVSARRPT